MAGRLAIDFGTSNTRAAIWNEGKGRADGLSIPDVSAVTRYRGADGNTVEVSSVPSLIHYDGNQVWIGRQVRDRGKLEAAATFRWMKRYISNRLELPRQVNGRTIKFSEAGADFLERVINYAVAAAGLGDEEVAFTAPVESYEHYQEWLTCACERAGIRRYRLLDEASAAALGYGVHIQAEDVYMVFDFGGGTLDAAIVKMETEVQGGKRCRVLGKGGADVGGTTVDQWLYEDALARWRKAPEDVRHMSAAILADVERAKEGLTTDDHAEITAADPNTGAAFQARYSRGEFEDLLEARGLFAAISRTLDHAEAEARERGYEREHLKSVLLVGGSSLIPSVRRFVRARYAGTNVSYHRPLDAVSLGAAAFVAGVDFYDHIQHDYAIRYYNRQKGDYAYLTIVPAGTPYPTAKAIKEMTIKASHDDQEFLGLDIYEVGWSAQKCSSGPAMDLVFDPAGGARFQPREEPQAANYYWVNEKCPTFIQAQPRAKKEDARFPAEFAIDGNKRLCVTVRDNQTGRTILRDHPVIKLR